MKICTYTFNPEIDVFFDITCCYHTFISVKQKHLLEVRREIVPSKFHAEFKRPNKTREERCIIKTLGYGPIEDDEQVSELILLQKL